MKNIILTGVAGFIGSKVTEKLLEKNINVIGIDNLNDYYDIRLKQWHIEQLNTNSHFQFYQINIEDINSLRMIFQNHEIDAVINLAARAGVRYSIKNPFIYHSTNVGGNLNLLEMCREFNTNKYILASTSSLYAGQSIIPFTEDLPVNKPISPYAATKKAAETMAYTYHYLYGIDVSIVRYFTVYGPAGRPDMSPFRFIKWISEGTPLTIYGDGSQERDFTYVDDIAEGTIKSLKPLGYEIINLGNNQPHKLSDMIKIIEKYTGKKTSYKYERFHKADMKSTWADINKANSILSWKPEIDLDEGIKRTVEWTKGNWDWVKNIKV
ncbi:MAG: GDP-mannose 4,6-dehydratase [Eubacteriaceae bacterium]